MGLFISRSHSQIVHNSSGGCVCVCVCVGPPFRSDCHRFSENIPVPANVGDGRFTEQHFMVIFNVARGPMCRRLFGTDIGYS